jgi:hypothetical protein
MATRMSRKHHRVEDVNLKPPVLPVGPPSDCPRCHGVLRVEIVTEPQPPRWACVMGHSGHFTWTVSRDGFRGREVMPGFAAASAAMPALAAR